MCRFPLIFGGCPSKLLTDAMPTAWKSALPHAGFAAVAGLNCAQGSSAWLKCCACDEPSERSCLAGSHWRRWQPTTNVCIVPLCALYGNTHWKRGEAVDTWQPLASSIIISYNAARKPTRPAERELPTSDSPGASPARPRIYRATLCEESIRASSPSLLRFDFRLVWGWRSSRHGRRVRGAVSEGGF
ncbi:hypothetical protein CALCODRAFT_179483 [Calocera cornea HHB12733]|uniref:Uncharacterized protein n=1 Tax=Calocera cornea HHB12733 TaxID=1353952 RepID=A0A165CD01_9BASI|nr:hypothetical protein CALCODRAFT_179483 [Calocera cornea HHB12733]